MNYKYSVLTFLFGDYECLHEVNDIQSDVEYICVTDNANLKSTTWKIVYDNLNPEYTSWRKVVEVRYNPFKYVSTDTCLIIDGAVQIQKFPRKLLEHFENNDFDMCLLSHPRQTLINELDAWKKFRNLTDIEYSAAKNFLNNINYGLTYKGLYQIGIMCMKNTEKQRKINQTCLSTLISLADENSAFRVDQVIVSTLLNKKFSDFKILLLDCFELCADYFVLYIHNSNRLYDRKENLHLELTKQYYLYNELVDGLYIENLKD